MQIGCIRIPYEKAYIIQLIIKILTKEWIKTRKLAQFVGKMIACEVVFEDVVFMKTKYSQAMIADQEGHFDR